MGFQDVAFLPSSGWFSITFLKIVVEVMTSGLPHVCELWLGLSKGMFPVEHLASKILIAVNYCGRQLARRLGWEAPAYHKKEGATLHPGACRYSLLCDRWPDWRFGLQVGTWKIGCLSGRGVEVCEELRKRMVDVCCLQEVSLRWHGARMLGIEGRRYNLWWSGKVDCTD